MKRPLEPTRYASGWGVMGSVDLYLLYLLYMPIEWVRYRFTPYRKATKHKYKLGILSAPPVKIYNQTAGSKTLTYHCHNNFEYFIQNNTVILVNWDINQFANVDGQWILYYQNDIENRHVMAEIAEDERASLCPKHQTLPIQFLITGNTFRYRSQLEQAKECPYFYCVDRLEQLR